MAKLIYPSRYICDCGHVSDFCENTVNEMREMSKRKRVLLSDSETNEHTVAFEKGSAVEILCPNIGPNRILWSADED